jgi:hypothetical protein
MPALADDLEFAILGRPFAARTAPPVLAEWLRTHWCFPEHQAAHHPFSIALHAGATPGETLPPGDEVPRTVVTTSLDGPLGWRGWEARTGEALWETGSPSCGLRLALTESSCGIDLWGIDAPGAGAILYPALYMAMSEALRASGLVPLHAAAVAREGGVTVFLGRSGAGKSTTALRATRLGWAPVAEDRSWLDPEALTLYGWDRGVRLLPDGHARFVADGDGAPWRRDVDGKLFLGYDNLGAGKRSGNLRRLAVLERGGEQPPGWGPLSSRDLVRALWEATGVPLATVARETVAALIPTILERVEYGTLRLGGEGELPL